MIDEKMKTQLFENPIQTSRLYVCVFHLYYSINHRNTKMLIYMFCIMVIGSCGKNGEKKGLSETKKKL